MCLSNLLVNHFLVFALLIAISENLNIANDGACSTCMAPVKIKYRGFFALEFLFWIIAILCAFLFHWLFLLAGLIYPFYRFSRHVCEKCGYEIEL